MRLPLAGLTAACMLLAGCGGTDGEDIGAGGTDPQLADYRKAIPAGQILLSPTLATGVSASRIAAGGRAAPQAVGDPALFPTAVAPISEAINGSVGSLIDILQTIVALPPTVFDSLNQEYVWGPFANEDDGFGTAALYIRAEPTGADFRYTYAFLRGVDDNLDGMTPVIWGGANPDPDDPDRGSGVTLWDFEANHDFAAQNDPDYATKTYDRGRFVALYGRDAGEDDPNAEVTLVVAAFRNFVPTDDPGADPTTVDYLYGNYAGPLASIDFMDFRAPIDVDEDDPTRNQLEDVSIRTAFLNEGWGRAEAIATGGDLGASERTDAVECWNTDLQQQFLQFELTDNGVSQFLVSSGDTASCGPTLLGVPLFSLTLDQLNIPKLEDVPQDLRDALDEAATNGIPPEA